MTRLIFITNIILGIILSGGVVAYIFSHQSSDFNFFDYENFDPLMAIYFLQSLNFIMLFKMFEFDIKDCEVHNEGLSLKNSKQTFNISYSEIKGISKFLGIFTIKLNEGRRFRIADNIFNKNKDIEGLIKEKDSVSKLPLYYSFAVPEISVILYCVFTFLFLTFAISGNKDIFQSYMPLPSIKVISLKGSISNEYYSERSSGSHINLEVAGNTNITTAKITLDEYPCIIFNLPYLKDLRDKQINFTGNRKLIENSTAHIKIRKRDYQKLLNGISNHSDYTHIKFYYLEVDGQVLIEKYHLKQIDS